MRAIVDQYLTSITKDVIAEQNRLGIRASGRSAKSLRRNYAGNDVKGVGKLLGAYYFERQFYGRGPTKRGGGGFLRAAIREWLDTKSFASSYSPKQKEGLSYAISKRIHERGTRRGNDPRYPAINFKGIVNKHKPKLKRDLGKATAVRFESEIIRAYTNVA